MPGRVRLIRAEGDRALVEVPHRAVPLARAAWSSSWVTDRGTALRARTRRTFGTLVKGKLWLRARREEPEGRRRRGV